MTCHLPTDVAVNTLVISRLQVLALSPDLRPLRTQSQPSTLTSLLSSEPMLPARGRPGSSLVRGAAGRRCLSVAAHIDCCFRKAVRTVQRTPTHAPFTQILQSLIFSRVGSVTLSIDVSLFLILSESFKNNLHEVAPSQT